MSNVVHIDRFRAEPPILVHRWPSVDFSEVQRRTLVAECQEKAQALQNALHELWSRKDPDEWRRDAVNAMLNHAMDINAGLSMQKDSNA